MRLSTTPRFALTVALTDDGHIDTSWIGRPEYEVYLGEFGLARQADGGVRGRAFDDGLPEHERRRILRRLWLAVFDAYFTRNVCGDRK